MKEKKTGRKSGHCNTMENDQRLKGRMRRPQMRSKKRGMAVLLTMILIICSFVTETAFAQGEADVVVNVGGRPYEAVFFNTEAAGELLMKMPFQLLMSELNGNEKYKYLEDSFSGNAQTTGEIQAGDIMLYGDDCLVLFYKSFRTSYKYTKIGRITDPSGLAEAAGAGDVVVSFSASSEQPVKTISLTKKNLTLRVGQSKKIKLSGAVVKKVKWSSSNKKVATVSGGKIKAKKAGKAVITAKYKGRKYRCTVTVKALR